MSKINYVGVYKITNTITNEFYIGCSSNIERRWRDHKTRYKNIADKEYNKKLYVAMREYGIDNFSFEILEKVEDICKMYEREKFYIDSLNAHENGYNEDYGKENHGRARLTTNDVVDIRIRYGELESKRNVYADYSSKISEGGFHKIWNGYTWPRIMMEVYTDENRLYHKNDTGSSGECNPMAKLSNEDVKKIWTSRKEGKAKADIYANYSNKITFGSFCNIWYKYNWKDIA